MTDPTAALREVLALSNKERDAEENREYGAANDLYAELQVAAVNLVRDHGPALLSALEDGARLDWLADQMRIAALHFILDSVPLDPSDLRAAIDAAREARND